MAFYLEKIGVFDFFPEVGGISGPIDIDTALKRFTERFSNPNPYKDELKRTIEYRKGYDGYLLKALIKLDYLFYKYIPKELFKKEPEKCYFLELNFFEEFYVVAKERTLLVYDISKADKEMIMINTTYFLIKILNEFYQNYKNYEPQKENYIEEKFIEEIIKEKS